MTEEITIFFQIIFIDLILAGDNAIIIGMVASKFPPEQRKKIIFWGIGGAVILRILLTLITAYLLQITGLRLLGGLLLLYIVYKLYVDVIRNSQNDEENIKVDSSSMLKAIWTVLLADFTMSLDNIFKEVKKLHYNPDKSYLNKDSVYFAHYSAAYQLFQKNKFFGVGLKNYRKFCNNSEFNKNIHPSHHGRKCATHPHNFYFEFLSEIGFLGFFLIMSFFIYSFYTFLKYKNNFLVLSSVILIVNFIPFLPRGSFFTNWNAIILWTVFAFIFSRCIKLGKL